jgi:hypothetical protein
MTLAVKGNATTAVNVLPYNLYFSPRPSKTCFGGLGVPVESSPWICSLRQEAVALHRVGVCGAATAVTVCAETSIGTNRTSPASLSSMVITFEHLSQSQKYSIGGALLLMEVTTFLPARKLFLPKSAKSTHQWRIGRVQRRRYSPSPFIENLKRAGLRGQWRSRWGGPSFHQPSSTEVCAKMALHDAKTIPAMVNSAQTSRKPRDYK